MEKCKYITIEREYGSGGTEIARLLAGQIGIPCYGQEILEEVSRERDIPVEKIPVSYTHLTLPTKRLV